jgi:hypothetical protein
MTDERTPSDAATQELVVDKPERHAKPTHAKPTHYKIICISMYTQDIEDLDAKVAELKRRGWTKANKSQLIRIALDKLDVATLDLPKQ